jgi:hypothetical protein
MRKARRALNLDRICFEKMEQIRRGMEFRPRQFAAKLFPDKPKHYVRTANLLALYIIELLEARRYRAQGHFQDARRVRERCRSIYEKLPEYARWRRA